MKLDGSNKIVLLSEKIKEKWKRFKNLARVLYEGKSGREVSVCVKAHGGLYGQD